MPDIELLGILKIMCDVVEGQQADMKYNSQTIEPPITLSCKVKIVLEKKLDNVHVIKINANMPDYFRFSTNKEDDKRAS